MSRVDPKKHLNDLSGKEYLIRTKSFFNQKGLGKTNLHALIERCHPAPFSFQAIQRLIGLFTKKGDSVLDPFMGVGSTAKAAILEGRDVVGIELVDRWANLAEFRLNIEVLFPNSFAKNIIKILEDKKLNDSKRIEQLVQKYNLPEETDLFKKIIQNIRKDKKEKKPKISKLTDVDKKSIPSFEILRGDVRNVVKDLISEGEIFDFIITSPPYWIILDKKADHKQKKERIEKGLAKNYGEDKNDLSKIKYYKAFLDELSEVFFNCCDVLRKGKFMVIIVQDFRHENRFVSFHADLIRKLTDKSDKRHLDLQGTQIILQNWKSLTPYGQPTAYVQNEHHQYALIFKKP